MEDVGDSGAKPIAANIISVSHYCPVKPAPPLPSRSEYTADPPPPQIFHISTPGLTKSQSLSSLLLCHVPLLPSLLTDLFELGSIHVQFPPRSAQDSPKPRRVHSSILLPAHTRLYIRVHAVPRRHKAVDAIRLLSCECEDLVAVGKPKGVPTVATADNSVENVVSMVREIKGYEKVCVGTRLDTGTSGVLLMGLNDGKEVNRVMKKARKWYVVDTWTKVNEGRMEGWIGGKWAWMVVEKSWRTRNGWKCRVRLGTGRTHQIRRLMAESGCGVKGDGRYGEGEGRGDRILGLHCEKVEWDGGCVEWKESEEN